MEHGFTQEIWNEVLRCGLNFKIRLFINHISGICPLVGSCWLRGSWYLLHGWLVSCVICYLPSASCVSSLILCPASVSVPGSLALPHSKSLPGFLMHCAWPYACFAASALKNGYTRSASSRSICVIGSSSSWSCMHPKFNTVHWCFLQKSSQRSCFESGSCICACSCCHHLGNQLHHL